jgi:hypothetical protein
MRTRRYAMEMTRREAMKLLSIGGVGSAVGGTAFLCAQAAESRILTVNMLANAVGLHIPANAAIFEILPSMPGYGVPKINRMEHHLTQIQTMMAGKADISNPDPTTAFRAAEGGIDVRVIGNFVVGDDMDLVVNADLVRSVADLAKPDIVVGVGGIGDAATHVVLVGPLLKRGIDLKAMTIVDIGGSSARMRALLSKRVHAVALHHDQALEMVKQGNFQILLELYKEYGLWLDNCWVASGAWLQKAENQRVAVDFMKATIIAFRRARNDFDWYARMFRKYCTIPKAAEMTDETIRPIWQRCVYDIKAWPASNGFTIQSYRDLMPVFIAAGAVKGTVKLEQVVDTAYVEQALKELGG